MLVRLKRLMEPRSRADKVRTTVFFSVLSMALSAAFAAPLAIVMKWNVLETVVSAAVIPLLIAPWMVWIMADVTIRLFQAHEQLEQLARTDPLTGALNRRGAQQLLIQAFERRHDEPGFCAIVLDIDNFKTVNDNYGHAGGDAVIVHVANVMRMAFDREDCRIVRFGGDELGILMPFLSIAEATLAAEHLRAAIERTPIVFGDRHITITASIGVAELLPRDESADFMLTRADASLYSAKMLGRNTVHADRARNDAAA